MHGAFRTTSYPHVCHFFLSVLIIILGQGLTYSRLTSDSLVAEDGLELVVGAPLPSPECWDYGSGSACLGCVVLEA